MWRIDFSKETANGNQTRPMNADAIRNGARSPLSAPGLVLLMGWRGYVAVFSDCLTSLTGQRPLLGRT